MALTDNLTSYYKSDTNGSFPDSAGSNNGTINGATFTVSGKINGCYDFDGTNDYIDCNFIPAAGDQSITAWFNTDSISGADPANFVCGSGNGGGAGMMDIIRISNTINVRLRVGGVDRTIAWSSTITTGVWYFVACTYDDTSKELTISVDGGTQVSNTYSGSVVTPTDNFIIGQRSTVGGGSRYWDGRIDEIAIWDRVITTSEITELYNGGDGLQYPFASFIPKVTFIN